MTEQKRAVVVDDNEVNRMLVARFLDKAGWQVTMLEDGQSALTWISANPVELVLLDISMPGLSGTDVCLRLRAEHLCPEARLVAYTAHAMPEERAHFLECGFDFILTKPISKASVFDMLTVLGGAA